MEHHDIDVDLEQLIIGQSMERNSEIKDSLDALEDFVNKSADCINRLKNDAFGCTLIDNAVKEQKQQILAKLDTLITELYETYNVEKPARPICGICLAPHKIPIAFDCGHIFCKNCSKRCSKKCPTCRTQVYDERKVFL